MLNDEEEIFQTEIEDSGPPGLGDPVIKYADRIMDRMKDVMPPGFPMRAFVPPELEHKVRIFRFDEAADLPDIERQIEALINDGWRIDNPGSCHNVLIMPLSRPKETKEDGEGKI